MKKRKLIFLVEDDEVFLQSTMSYLNQEFGNFQLEIFSSLEGCLKKINLNPNIIILNYSPTKHEEEITFSEVLKRISKNASIIFYTMNDHSEFLQSCVDSGLADYIVQKETSAEFIHLGLKSLGRKIHAIEEERISNLSTFYALAIVIGIALLFLIIWSLFLNKSA